MRFNLTFLTGMKEVATVKGINDFDFSGKNPAIENEIGLLALEVEKTLERLTGLRVHVTTEGK